MKGRSRLAGYGKRGPIWVNRKIPTSFRGIRMKSRTLTHEKTERPLRKPKKKGGEGLSYGEAHQRGLKKEHKGLTKHQIFVYEGKLGSIARQSKSR